MAKKIKTHKNTGVFFTCRANNSQFMPYTGVCGVWIINPGCRELIYFLYFCRV
jgi:hypothetical protein